MRALRRIAEKKKGFDGLLVLGGGVLDLALETGERDGRLLGGDVEGGLAGAVAATKGVAGRLGRANRG